MRKFITGLFILIPLVFLFILSSTYYSCASDQNLKNCSQIKEKITTVLNDLLPDVKIIEINDAPVDGLCEIALESKGRKGIVYVDISKQYLISGSILNIKTKENLTQAKLIEINKVDVSQIPLDDALIMGDKEAKHRVIVFSDPDCPYCEKLHREMKKVLEKRTDIVFFIKMYPLPFHKNAYKKSQSIVCEKSLDLLEDAFAKKSLPEPKCETAALDENIELAKKLGIQGTPAIILPNGSIIPSYKDADSLISLIDNQS
jgi:thiol:disulfide interchange protein DsbC